jgi:ABC-2 type transport system permease protein
MIHSQFALIQREFWEHRAIYVTPIVIGLVISLMAVTGQVSISGNEHVDVALIGLSNLGEQARATAITAMMLAIFVLFVLAMSVLTVFYSLDSLFAERKDRSILFWRSIPVTDSETVLSKLITALFVIPLVTFAAIVLTHLVVGIIMSIWVGIRGANAWHLIWQAAPLFDNWAATFAILLGSALWLSPFVGWFLLVSAYTKRSPFLVAFLPIVVLPMLEKSLIGSEMFKDAIFVRTAQNPLFKDMDTLEQMFNDDDLYSLAESGVSVVSILDFGRFFSSPGLWVGLVVCGIFTTAAIYVRRYRDDS